MLGGNARRIADGEPPLELSAPTRSETFAQPMQLARIHQYLSMATPLLWTRQPDTVGVIGLALNTCGERNGYPDERRAHPRAARGGARPLDDMAARDRGRARPAACAATFRLVYLADILAVTVRCLSCASTAARTASTRRSAGRSRRCCATTSA